MSTLNTRKIKHDSSSVDNITLTSNAKVGVGGVTPSQRFVAYDSTGGADNIIMSESSAGTKLFMQADPNTNTGVFGTFGDTAIRFMPNNTERMRIDTAGRVTMPYQPAFMVADSNLTSAGPNEIIEFNQVILNNGGHFSTATSRFTAPISGIYYFHYHSFLDTTNSSGSEVYLYKNGGNNFPRPIRNYTSDISGAYGPPVTIQATVYLSANDYVQVWTQGLILHGNDANYFGGYLIG